jgi:NADH-quinone oxidoreductase subunit K
MLTTQLTINTLILFIGLLGVYLNFRNLFLALLGIELMLLSINLNFSLYSIYLNDIIGQLFSIFILTVAASEAAIGLAILIIIFFKTKNIITNEILKTKG